MMRIFTGVLFSGILFLYGVCCAGGDNRAIYPGDNSGSIYKAGLYYGAITPGLLIAQNDRHTFTAGEVMGMVNLGEQRYRFTRANTGGAKIVYKGRDIIDNSSSIVLSGSEDDIRLIVFSMALDREHTVRQDTESLIALVVLLTDIQNAEQAGSVMQSMINDVISNPKHEAARVSGYADILMEYSVDRDLIRITFIN